MPLTISNFTGDGINDPQIASAVELPDSGTTVLVSGTVVSTGGSRVTITGSPLTMPAAPGSGSIYWCIEINTSTGAATLLQSTSGMPTADPSNIIIFQQTLGTTSTDAALVSTDITPDTY